MIYLDPTDAPRERQLYILAKIHNAPEKLPQKGKMPPGRPILSDCGTGYYRIAEYID